MFAAVLRSNGRNSRRNITRLVRIESRDLVSRLGNDLYSEPMMKGFGYAFTSNREFKFAMLYGIVGTDVVGI